MKINASNLSGDYMASFSVKLAHKPYDTVQLKANGATVQEYSLEGMALTDLSGVHILSSISGDLELELVTTATVIPNTLQMWVRKVGD